MKHVKLFEDFVNEVTTGYDFVIKEIEDNDYIVRAMYKGKSVGELRFIKRRSKPFLMAGSLSVDPNHRRKGIASSMYEFAEKELGMKFVRSEDVLTPDGKMLWNNPNRKFGLSEGIRQVNGEYVFDWMTDLPGDLMSLRFGKYSGRTQKVSGSETTYTYYYAYQLDKSDGSTNLMKSIKSLESNISSKNLQLFVNKAVMGFDSTFGTENYAAIVSPESSSLILNELITQLSKKSTATKLFSNAFVKAASTDIKLDFDKVDKLPEKTKKEVMRVFSKVTRPGQSFKIKEIFSRQRKFFKEFILFNNENDRQLINQVEGNTVILVDDYRTTGTTIKEMIAQLTDAGAKHIVVFVLIKLGE